MPVDISTIVTVNMSTFSPGDTGVDIEGLILTKNQSIPIGGNYTGLLQFGNKEEVGAAFGTASVEYAMAEKYFLGLDVKTRTPGLLMYGLYSSTALPAWLQGAPIDPVLSTFTSITSGAMSIKFSGSTITITPVNLSTVTSFSEVASIVQEAIRTQGSLNSEVSTCTVIFDGVTRTFKITGGTGGLGKTVNGATGNLATAMNITDTTPGVVQSIGADAMDLKGTLTRYQSASYLWTSYTTAWNATQAEKISLLQFQAASDGTLIYVPWSDAAAIGLPGSTTDDATVLEKYNVDVTFTYGDYVQAGFVLGAYASTNYTTGENSVINFAHKSQKGLPYTVNNTTLALVLEQKKVNFYGNYSRKNGEFEMFFPGMTMGPWQYMNRFAGSVWFKGALQIGLSSGLNNSRDVPYNQDGASKARAFCQGPIDRALSNGVIRAGIELSQAQTADLISEAGSDAPYEVETNGYFLRIRVPAPEVRAKRGSFVMDLWYTDGGSVNRLHLNVRSYQ